jgi:hypothetical protein
MARDANTTVIDATGLRYKSKVPGTIFADRSNLRTMSCYKCGEHKPRSLGSFRNILSRATFFCGDCRPVQKAVEAG